MKRNHRYIISKSFIESKGELSILKKSVLVAVIIGIVIIIGVIGFQNFSLTSDRTTSEEYYETGTGQSIKTVVYPENPQTLYGLTVTKDKYLLGENVFMKIGGIPMGLQDRLQVFTPTGINYLNLEINGNERDSFKHYFKPGYDRSMGICFKEQIVGEWIMLFEGFPEEKLKFQVMDEYLPYSEELFVDCEQQPMTLPDIVKP